jgi:hypothetical protein
MDCAETEGMAREVNAISQVSLWKSLFIVLQNSHTVRNFVCGLWAA